MQGYTAMVWFGLLHFFVMDNFVSYLEIYGRLLYGRQASAFADLPVHKWAPEICGVNFTVYVPSWLSVVSQTISSPAGSTMSMDSGYLGSGSPLCVDTCIDIGGNTHKPVYYSNILLSCCMNIWNWDVCLAMLYLYISSFYLHSYGSA